MESQGTMRTREKEEDQRGRARAAGRTDGDQEGEKRRNMGRQVGRSAGEGKERQQRASAPARVKRAGVARTKKQGPQEKRPRTSPPTATTPPRPAPTALAAYSSLTCATRCPSRTTLTPAVLATNAAPSSVEADRARGCPPSATVVVLQGVSDSEPASEGGARVRGGSGEGASARKRREEQRREKQQKIGPAEAGGTKRRAM